MLAYKKQAILLTITGLLLGGFLFDVSPVFLNQGVRQGRLNLLFESAGSFLVQFGRTATTLRELEMFAEQNSESVSNLKNAAGIFSYQRLNKRFFVLQEYINEGHKISFSASNVIMAQTEFDLSSKKNIHFFPFEMLDGIEIGPFNASIIVDAYQGEKHLVIKKKQDGVILVAPHDFVDEYFILPGYKKIVFTASAKNNWPSGIFLWDLEQDIVQLLSESTNLNITKTVKNSQVTLVGMSSEWIYFFIKNDSNFIFNCQNLFGFSLITSKIEPQKTNCMADEFFKTAPFLGHSAILKMLNTQSLEVTIDWWQENLAHSGQDRASTPHALWILANLYVQLAADKKVPAHQKKTLEIFAREILSQLRSMTTTPQYLRELSASALITGNLSKYLRFQFTSPESLTQ